MPDRLNLTCQVCGNTGLEDGDDGFYYCQRCGSQADGVMDTDVAEEDFVEHGEFGGIYLANNRHTRVRPVTIEPISQSQQPQQSQFWDSIRALEDDDHNVGDGLGPTGPSDFGSGSKTFSYNDYHLEIRLRYVMGIQIMIQLQCKALVEEFNVSPLIVGLIEPIWLRLVALTRILDDKWADEAIHESESQKQGPEEDFKPEAKYSAEPHNILGQRAVMIWYRYLSKTIPLSYSLVISFLVCHVAREAILPTDILKWTLEGKLPYFAVFVEIEKLLGPPSSACPFSSSRMFRPTQAISLQKLESLAGSVAQTIGLELPPVNFYAIASRYLRQLSLPVGKILPQACRIYEWSMPAELWLSANELRLPTRVCVISILIVTIRILYNLNGLGKWETSLSSSGDSSSLVDQTGKTEPTGNAVINDGMEEGLPSHNSNTKSSYNLSDVQQSEFDAAELLQKLATKYDDLVDTYEYSEDLPTYLQYCKDVVFAGLEPSFEDLDEEKMIEEFWNFYQDKKGVEPTYNQEAGSLRCTDGLHKRSRDDAKTMPKESKKFRDNVSSSNRSEDSSTSHGGDCLQTSMNDENALPRGRPNVESDKDRAIRRMKSNMEENRFCYIPPRVIVKRSDYIHYARKKDEGAYTYAAHADYYILLRSCARAAQVDIRTMHIGVLSFERRLIWLEKRIDYCLHLEPTNDSCEFCRDEVEEKSTEESVEFSKLNL